MTGDIWLTRKQAANYLTRSGCGVQPKTLANMAANNNAKGGPPFVKTRNRIVRYREADLRAWAEQETRRVG